MDPPFAPPPLLHLLLFFSILPSILAAYSPNTTFFLACGAANTVSFPQDSPPRNFTPDKPYLSSPPTSSISNPNKLTSPLYSTARVSSTTISYRFKGIASPSWIILRLHFFPFSAQSQDLSTANFNVSALDEFVLLSDFSPVPNVTIKEFFLWAGSGQFDLVLTPNSKSVAFINAIELFTAPAELLSDQNPTTLESAPAIGPLNQQALETVHRINMGGPQVTPQNDTLWRSWLPDDAYIFAADLSVENNTQQPPNYQASNGLVTPEIAPIYVYDTARTMRQSQNATISDYNFNVTWTFPVAAGYQYLVRLHFCDFFTIQTSVIGADLKFDVYIMDSMAVQDLSPDKQNGGTDSVPFYNDFISDVQGPGNITISIGRSQKSTVPNAILNGLEIMKVNNSFASLNGSGNPNLSPAKTGVSLGIVLVFVISGVAIIGLTVLCVFCIVRRRRGRPAPAPETKESTPASTWAPYRAGGIGSTNISSSRSREGTTDGASPKVNLGLLISFAKIKAATNNFDDSNLIGEGGFGKVYKGILSDGTEVAVKRGTKESTQGFPEFQTEIVVLSSIRHRHLVSLIGYCDEQAEMILVYEYMEKGPLRNYLYGPDAPCLSWKQRLEICIGAAKGLHYLHTGYSSNIIHRDVKSTNILLCKDFVAKVSDFGLSKMGPSYGQTHVSTVVKGSFGYLDPEYFKTQKLTDKSDVYSFGVVLLEVLCTRPVMDQSLERNEINIAEWALRWLRRGHLDKIVDPKLVGNANENSLSKFAKTAERCLADYGDERPTMGDVLWNLEYCLQLQETELRREAYEDSGNVDSQFPAVVMRRMPSTVSTVIGGVDDTSIDVSNLSASKVFSQLISHEGR